MIRLKRVENIVVNEAKQVGDLYHICTISAFCNHIIPKNELKASGKYQNKRLNTNQIVSFTRDSLFVVPTETVRNAPILFQIKVDGNKLSNKYKIYSYNDYAPGRDEKTNDGDSIIKNYKQNPRYFEHEEVVIGPISNFKSYIKSVAFDIKDLDILFDSPEYLLKYLEEVKTYLGSIPCKRVSLPLTQGSYRKSSKETFSIKTLDDVIDIIKNSESYNKDSLIDTIDLLHSGRWISSKQLVPALINHPNIFNKKQKDEYFFKEGIEKDNIEVVKTLITYGVDIDTKYNNCTGLYICCLKNKSLDIIKLLLDNGADVNYIPSYSDRSCLGLAIQNNNYMLVKLLVEHGAEINIKGMDGDDQPLSIACESFLNYRKEDSLKIIKLLLENGADPNIVLSNNCSLLFSAVTIPGHTEIAIELAELLLKNGANPNFNKDHNVGLPFLLNPISSNNIPFIKLVLEKGYDIKDDIESLSLALSTGRVEIIELFVKYGATLSSLNESNKNGEAYLFDACRSGDLKLVHFLLDNGVDVNIQDKKKKTPLIWTCIKGFVDIVKLLLSYDADMYLEDREGFTALKASIFYDHLDVAKVLLENGALDKYNKNNLPQWILDDPKILKLVGKYI